jgi:hypothetical protein
MEIRGVTAKVLVLAAQHSKVRLIPGGNWGARSYINPRDETVWLPDGMRFVWVPESFLRSFTA